MLILFGPRGVTVSRARGRFRCPACGVLRQYTRRRVRHFFAILRVPLIPLRGERSYVRCGFCRRVFDPSVVESPRPGLPLGTPVPVAPDDPVLTGVAASMLLTWDETGSED